MRACCLALAVAGSGAAHSHAAGWAPLWPPLSAEYPGNAGVPCSAGAPFWAPPTATAAVLPWRSVWLGHFSGGRHYEDAYGEILIDWRNEKLCFPSRRQCQAWIREQSRAFHQPEGYWTCLFLR